MTPIRVMVVDDHSVVREGIRHVLSDTALFAVVGEEFFYGFYGLFIHSDAFQNLFAV